MKTEIQIFSQKHPTSNQYLKYQNTRKNSKISNNVCFSTLSEKTKRIGTIS